MTFDLGATSGRTVLGMLSSGELRIRELTRFPNQTLPLGGHFYWNIFSLYGHLCDGLRAAVRDFALTKGLPVALLAGVMSARFALGLDVDAQPYSGSSFTPKKMLLLPPALIFHSSLRSKFSNFPSVCRSPRPLSSGSNWNVSSPLRTVQPTAASYWLNVCQPQVVFPSKNSFRPSWISVSVRVF